MQNGYATVYLLRTDRITVISYTIHRMPTSHITRFTSIKTVQMYSLIWVLSICRWVVCLPDYLVQAGLQEPTGRMERFGALNLDLGQPFSILTSNGRNHAPPTISQYYHLIIL